MSHQEGNLPPATSSMRMRALAVQQVLLEAQENTRSREGQESGAGAGDISVH